MAARTGSHHWIITLRSAGGEHATREGTFNPAQSSTRQGAYSDIYDAVVSNMPRSFADADVLFFALESNQL